MATARTAVKAEIIGDASKFNRATGDALGGMDKLAIGAATAGAAVAAAFVTAGIKAGTALFELGQKFDATWDNLRIGTGATGDALGELQDVVRDIARDTPSGLENIGIAVGDLNTRLGLTGEPLANVARQMLDLTRMTGGDLEGNLRNTSRAFADFEVPVEEMPGKLDLLLRAWQNSGLPFDEMTEKMVSVGVPLRQLGFNFDEAAALIAQFEKKGVNSEKALSSLTLMLGKMADAGEEPIDTFRRIQTTIQEATSQGAANTEALKRVGSRAMADFADVVGKAGFNVEEFLGIISEGDTIQGLAEETDSFGEAWQLVKQNAELALEPLASGMFQGLSEDLEELLPYLEDAGKMFAAGDIEGGFEKLGEMWDEKIKPKLEEWVEKFGEWWDETGGPLVGELLGNALSEGWDLAFDTIKEKLTDTGWIKDALLMSWFGPLRLLIIEALPGIATDLWGWFSETFEAVPEKLGQSWEKIENWFGGLPEKIGSVASGMWDSIGDAFKEVLNRMIRWWNSLSFSTPDIPGTDFGGQDFSMIQIPELHSGGVYNAPRPGGEGLALLRDGETVLPTRPGQRGGGMGRPIEIPVVIDGREVARVSAPHLLVMEDARR